MSEWVHLRPNHYIMADPVRILVSEACCHSRSEHARTQQVLQAAPEPGGRSITQIGE